MIFSIACSMKKHAHKWSNIWICEVLIHMSFHLSLIYFIQNLDQLIQLHTHKVVLYTGKLIKKFLNGEKNLQFIADWHGLSFLDLKYNTFSRNNQSVHFTSYARLLQVHIHVFKKKKIKNRCYFVQTVNVDINMHCTNSILRRIGKIHVYKSNKAS